MHDDDDPTKVTNQPSLTTSQGTIWLVMGGLMSAISIVLLWSLQRVNSTGIAIAGIVVIALLFVGMLEVRLLVRTLRTRLLLLAIGFGAIAVVSLAAVVVIGASEVAP